MTSFEHTTDIDVRFRDTDAMGHVNNAVYLTYIEVARQEHWQRLAPQVDYNNVPFVVAHATIDFRSPAQVGETIRVSLRTDWIGRSSYGLSYELRERTSGRLLAEAATVIVTYDYAQHRPMPVPDWLREGLERVAGRSLPDRSHDP